MKNKEIKKIKKLIKDIPGGIYQDIILKKQKIQGACPVSCWKRWKQIRLDIPIQGVVCDLGSAEGYFTLKIAQTRPQVLVWSIEENPERAQIQKELLKLHKIKNVVLCNSRFNDIDLYLLSECVEGIDLFLILSVFHHQLPEISQRMVEHMAKIAPKIIVEFPKLFPMVNNDFPDLTQAILQNQYSNFDKILHKNYIYIEKIAENFCGQEKEFEEKRVIYYGKNFNLKREFLGSYFSRYLMQRGQTIYNKLAFGNRGWVLKRKFEPKNLIYDRPIEKWISGLNLYNLLQFNLIYPEQEDLEKEIREKYMALLTHKPTEIGLKNCLYTSHGVEPIDWKHNDPHFNFKTFESEIEKTIQELYAKTGEDY